MEIKWMLNCPYVCAYNELDLSKEPFVFLKKRHFLIPSPFQRATMLYKYAIMYFL